MKIIAVTNQKGGSGKTTTAHSLAAAWGAAGEKVLLVDLDGQHALSRWCGQREPAAGWYDALAAGGADPRGAIVPEVLPGVDLLPSCPAMGRLPLRPTQRDAVAISLAHVARRYRWCLLDCPPAMGPITENAIVAADIVLVPVEASWLAADGAEMMLQALGDFDRQGIERRALFVVCRVRRTRVSVNVLAELRDSLGADVCETFIRDTTRMQEAPEAGTSIFDHAPDSTAAEDYRALALELKLKVR